MSNKSTSGFFPVCLAIVVVLVIFVLFVRATINSVIVVHFVKHLLSLILNPHNFCDNVKVNMKMFTNCILIELTANGEDIGLNLQRLLTFFFFFKEKRTK